jgi:putative ABC transport system ATP-binding protein
MSPVVASRQRDGRPTDDSAATSTASASTAATAAPTPPRPREIAVQARDVVKVYRSGAESVRALAGVTVGFGRAEFTAIMGPSGSGKSTLMHCLAGLDTTTSGQVWLGHLNLADMGDSDRTRLRRERIGFVFQSFNLLGMLTAKQNILLPFDLAGREPDWTWFDSVVEVLGIGGRLSHRPSQLSGGEQQRVAVARALVARPDVVFADEPTGNLDSTTGGELLEFLRRSVRELAQTVVMVTHDPTAAGFADRVVLLADGRLAGDLDQPDPSRLLAALGRAGR